MAAASVQDCERIYYAMQDANFNVLGVVDNTGTLIERYEYSPYGERTVYFSVGSNDTKLMTPTQLSRRVTYEVDDGNGGTITLHHPYGLNPIGHQGLMHDDPLGLWEEVDQDGGSYAKTMADGGDNSIQSLADMIYLDANEVNLWINLEGADLEVTDAQGNYQRRRKGNLKPTDVVCPGQSVSVPNTIYISVGDTSRSPVLFGLLDVEIRGAIMATVRSYRRAKQGEGFRVVTDEHATLQAMEQQLKNADIHGWMFAGHGSGGVLIDAPGQLALDAFTANRVKHHALGEVILYAYEAGVDDDWTRLVAPNGTLRATCALIRVRFKDWDDVPIVPPGGWPDDDGGGKKKKKKRPR